MTNAIKELTQQRLLLQMEYEEEKKAFGDITERTGIARLVERGAAWFPVSVVCTRYNSLNNRILEIARREEDEIEHGFEYGKPVVFISAAPDGKIKYLFSGSVSYVDGNRMLAVIPDSADTNTLTGGSAGVVLSFDETSYRTMFEAIDRTMKAKGRLGELRDLFYSRRKAETLSLPPMRFPYLNATQESAVNKVLASKDIAIVHGPPGTGKTTTLVEAIHETLRRESQVLVCAQSNVAVDWISEKLSDRGVSVLRLGNPSRVNDKMLASTYERRFEAHPDYPTLWSIRKSIREMQGARRHATEQWHRKIDRMRSRATELEIRINNDLFDNARVIASTLVGSASSLLDGKKFSTLFIDEAAQALEAAAWIPIRRAGRVIFAGDHCQLPPVVKCFEAQKAGLGKSLMERIVENHPETVTLLSVQYRMNEAIMRFSSEWFYNGNVSAAQGVRYRGILDFDTPIEWIDTSHILSVEQGDGLQGDKEMSFRESVAGESYGRVNSDEALLAIHTLQNYIGRIGKRRFLEERIDVGVISPYRAQVHYLRRLLFSTPFFKPFRTLISVNTVDGFQGRECDVILISLVRSNESGQIGFLRDLRRMNVAMTRARMKLLIIGNVPTLTSHPFFRKLYSYINSLDNEQN